MICLAALWGVFLLLYTLVGRLLYRCPRFQFVSLEKLRFGMHVVGQPVARSLGRFGFASSLNLHLATFVVWTSTPLSVKDTTSILRR